MKCSTSFVLLTASVVGVLAGDAHIAKTCNTNGQAALLIDGLSKSDGPKLLAALARENVTALIAAPKVLLSGEDHIKLLEHAKKGGHELGYRVQIKDNHALAALKDSDLLSELEDAKRRFQEIYSVSIKYVMFPYTKDTDLEARFAAVAKKAGLTAIGHSLYLASKEKDAKKSIKQNLYDATEASYIALLEGSSNDHESVIHYYKQAADRNHFSLVSMSECLSGSNRTVKKHTRAHHQSSSASYVKSSKKTHHHNKKHGKKSKISKRNGNGKNKKMVKKGVLVPPEYIQGYKKLAASKGKRNGHKNDKVMAVSVEEPVKLPANKEKDFDMAPSEPIGVKNASEGKKSDSDKVQATNNNKTGAGSMVKVGGTTILGAVVALIVALF